MTANELINELQKNVNRLTSGWIDVKINGEDVALSVELVKCGERDYYINIETL